MASAADIKRLRNRIGDRLKADKDLATANGVDRVYNLRFNNVFNVIGKINGVVTTAFTLEEESGTVTFTTAPNDGDEIEFTYNYAAYTDDELSDMIDSYGFNQSVKEALMELLADAARLFDYSQGQTRASKSQVFDHLKQLLATYDVDSDVFVDDTGKSVGGVQLGKRTTEVMRPSRKIVTDLSRLDESILQ